MSIIASSAAYPAAVVSALQGDPAPILRLRRRRIDCVGHRDVDHRHSSRPGIAGYIAGFQDLERGLVPLRDDIGVRCRRAERHDYRDR